MLLNARIIAFSVENSFSEVVERYILINGQAYTEDEFNEFLQYIEPVSQSQDTPIIEQRAFVATIPAWAVGKWVVAVAGTFVAVHVTPTVIKVGTEIIDSASETYSNILQAIKEKKEADAKKKEKPKKKPSKKSGKEKASDVPSWVRGYRSLPGENGREFAKRVCDHRYGKNNYPVGAGSEYSKIQKWIDRGFN